ncbi:hypothetical protein GGF37_004176, partial [Kickxella alabastrina]
MSTEQQTKRRRTDSRATDVESQATETPSSKPSPTSARRTPSGAQSLPSIRSPATPALQQTQQLQPVYYQDTIDTNSIQQYQYQSQHHTPQSHFSGNSQASSSTPVPSVSSVGHPQSRYFSATHQQQPGSHQLAMVGAHASSSAPGAVPTPMPSVHTTLNPARSAMPQQQQHQQFLAASHSIPATLYSQTHAVGNHDYNMWFYSQQQQQQQHISAAAADRSAAVAAAVGSMAGSTSVSPVSQHALAPADQQYPMQGQFDNQMRYMTVPGHPSGMPKPINSATVPLDRSGRSNASVSQQQQFQNQQQQLHHQQQQNHGGFSAMQQYHHPYQQAQVNPHYANYYHAQVQQQQQQQQQHNIHQSVHAHMVQQQMSSPFPTQGSAVAATAGMGDNSSGHVPMGASSSNSVLHTGSYGTVNSTPDQVSAAQVAAAVAAVTASVHTHPMPGVSMVVGGSSNGPVVSSGGNASGCGVIGMGSTGRLGMGLTEVDQSGMPAFKFTMNMQSNGETGLPEYFENYTQNYMPSAPSVMEPSPSSPTEQTLDSDLIIRLDDLFMKYLEQICSNNITVDSEGES